MRTVRADVETMAHSYDLAWRWITETLPQGDSLLTPGSPIWTPPNLAELREKFIRRPDETTGRSFLQKLQRQLRDASPGAVQLMAELHVVFFQWIWEGAISGEKKLSDINAILSWHPERPQVPDRVVEVLSTGVAHPGQWAMSRRDTQISALIEIALRFAETAENERDRLLEDPFAFRDFVLGVASPTSDAVKWGTIHMVFPDTFESIVSPQHKRAILERFKEHADGEQDADRALYKIREGLTPTYGQAFSYYSNGPDPLLHLWSKDSQHWGRVGRWLDRLAGSLNLDEEERSYKLDVAQAWSGHGRASSLVTRTGRKRCVTLCTIAPTISWRGRTATLSSVG